MEKIEFYHRKLRKYFIDIFSRSSKIIHGKYFYRHFFDIFSNFSNECHKIF